MDDGRFNHLATGYRRRLTRGREAKHELFLRLRTRKARDCSGEAGWKKLGLESAGSTLPCDAKLERFK